MRGRLPRLLAQAALVVGAVVFAYPFVWMALATLKPEAEIAALNPLPSRWTAESYRLVFETIPLGRAFWNSVLVTGLVTTLALFFGSVTAYALSRLSWRGREAAFALILFTMMVPFLVLLIPLYTLVVGFGWTDSYAGLVVPFMMNATAVLILRQHFLSLPQGLIDAARIDGAGEFRILFRIVWPLSVPALVTAGIIVFIGSWNEVLWPLLVVRDEAMMTMPQMVTLFAVGGGAESRLGPQLAAALLLALPVLLAYAAFQRRFVESLATTGLKG
ncbi:carbohydrate ABC transporter permease [Rubrivirga marina]|uniref:Sugar ABC transporter permease n=1 Tax=Rubrivirga marina TaxID=1196024 RepID=A0A271IW85_9BACT|nr:carbohydrate ABC transporter permease [Rubrivirga marina]PAP75377.1 sugar ABC transporter permease [Rubrivirga marina]